MAYPFPRLTASSQVAPPGAYAAPTPLVVPYPRASGRARLDGPNEVILALLATHGRATLRELGHAAGLSESSVRERVSTLELQGVVTGYGARIDWARAGLPVHAMIEADCSPGKGLDLTRLLHAMPAVTHAVVTTGSPNFVAVLRARDLWDVRTQLAQIRNGPLSHVRMRVAMEELVSPRPPRPASTTASPAAEARLSSPLGTHELRPWMSGAAPPHALTASA